MLFFVQKSFIQKKFSERFAAKNKRLSEYANHYGKVASEDVRNEVENFVKRSKERFDNCISSFHELENWTKLLIERMEHHASVSMEAEKWLRKAEEVITTEPKWKIQVS